MNFNKIKEYKDFYQIKRINLEGLLHNFTKVSVIICEYNIDVYYWLNAFAIRTKFFNSWFLRMWLSRRCATFEIQILHKNSTFRLYTNI